MALNSNDRFVSVEQFWQAFSAQEAWRPLRNFANAPSTGPMAAEIAIHTLVPASAAERAHSRRFSLFLILLLLLALLLVAGSFASYLFYLRLHQAATSAAVPTARPTVASNTSPITIPTQIPSAVLTTPTARSTSAPAKQPVVVPTAHPTLPPTQRPNSTPTPHPMPRPTPSPTPVPYPIIAGVYNGTLDDTTANIVTGMSLSIQQNAGLATITGYFTVNAPLLGDGNFAGTVNTVKYVQFIVQSYKGNSPLYFWGWVQTDGSLQGNYCSVNKHNQCDPNAGASGTWDVAKFTS